MTFTLGELIYRVAREVVDVREGTVTGGTTTTIIDTVNRKEPDDYWNNGTAFMIYDAGGAGAAPENEYKRITDFANSTNTITVASAFTVAPAAGDRYAVMNRRIPLNILIQSVNRTLQDLGNVPVTDITSLDTADNQTEYELPVAANTDLRQVWVQTNLDDADDYRWEKLFNWYVQTTATGSSDLLVFPYQLPSGYDLKLVYVGPHDELSSATSQLSESIYPERIIYRAAYHTLNWMKRKIKPKDRQYINEEIEKMNDYALKSELEHPIKIPPRTTKIVMVNTGMRGEDFTAGTVRLSDL